MNKILQFTVFVSEHAVLGKGTIDDMEFSLATIMGRQYCRKSELWLTYASWSVESL